MTKKRKNKGNTLIIVLSTMLLLVTMGITFLSMSGLELKTTSTLDAKLKAKLAANAGIEYAITQLRNIFNQSIDGVGTSVWWFSKTSTKAKSYNNNYNCSEEYDNASPYTLLESLHKDEDSDSAIVYYPSFIMSIDEQPKDLPYSNISGILGQTDLTTISDSNEEKKVFNPMTQYPFTLKVVDTTSQFPINTHATYRQILDSLSGNGASNDHIATPIVGKMLNRLSREIAKMSWYTKKEGNRETEGPLQGLGEEIIKKRNQQGGFYSKYDIVGTYSDAATITLEDVADIWNYITVYPTWKQMGESSIYRNIAPLADSDASYRIEYRCPININTASFPVLMAVLDGISTSSSDSNLTISPSEARYIATNIIDSRKNTGCFKNWTAFKKFFDVLKEDLKNTPNQTLYELQLFSLYNNFEDKVNLLMANFDPNVHLKESNPDKAVYQPITKIELNSYTTEFCFFPLGQFDITSLGEVFNHEGNVVSSSQTSSIIKIYETIYQTSQYDFECGPKEADQLLNPSKSDASSYVVYQGGTLTERTSSFESAKLSNGGTGAGRGHNAFSSGNNLLQDSYFNINELWKASSKCFGYIIPLGIQLTTGAKNLDHLDSEDCYYFRQDFSSSNLNLLKNNALNIPGYPDPNDLTGVFNPNKSEKLEIDSSTETSQEQNDTTLGYLYADGFCFRPHMTSLYHNITESNFSPLSDSENNNATIMFWFKINNTWDDPNKDYTVFFSNQVGKVNDISLGIQHEIKFKVEKTNALVRKLTITITNSLYSNDSIVDNNNNIKENFVSNWNSIPYKMFTKKVIILDPENNTGIHAQEWYHLAIRFHKGLELTNFSENTNTTSNIPINTTSTDAALAICGNFYNNNDGILCNPNSTSESIESIARILDTDNLTINNKNYKILDISSCEDKSLTQLNSDDKSKTLTEQFNLITKSIEEKLLRSNCTNQNRFYLGTVTEDIINNDVPQMTIDDFRISKSYLKTIDANDTTYGIYQPSRYPTSVNVSITSSVTDAIPVYSVFQGKMLGDANGTVTSFSWTARETEKLRPGYSARVVSQTKTVDGTEHTEDYYENLFNKFLGGDLKGKDRKSDKFLKEGQTYKHFKEKTSWTARIEITETKQKPKVAKKQNISLNTVSIKESNQINKNLKLYQKDVDFTKDFGNNLEEYDKSIMESKGKTWNEKDCTKTRYEETICSSAKIEDILDLLAEKYKYIISSNPTDKEKVTQEFIKESAEVTSSTPLNANNTPYVFDDEHKSFVYELVFPSSGSGAIFNGPVIDDVTLIYLLKDPEFLEHSSGLIQH